MGQVKSKRETRLFEQEDESAMPLDNNGFGRNLFNDHFADVNVFPREVYYGLNRNNSAVFNQDNCSVFEKQLPDDVFVNVLTFLQNEELIKLRRVCRNYCYYWLEKRQVWEGRELKDCSMWFKPVLTDNSYHSFFYVHSFFSKMVNHVKQYRCADLEPLSMVLMGADWCGKTEFIQAFLDPKWKFENTYSATLGSCKATKTFSQKPLGYTLSILDTGGSQQHLPLAPMYCNGARGLFFCFDLNSNESFELVKKRIETFGNGCDNSDIYKHLIDHQKCLIIVGMKRDLERNVEEVEISKLLSEIVPNYDSPNGIPLSSLRVQYFEVSTKGDSLKELAIPFYYATSLLERIDKKSQPTENTTYAITKPTATILKVVN